MTEERNIVIGRKYWIRPHGPESLYITGERAVGVSYDGLVIFGRSSDSSNYMIPKDLIIGEVQPRTWAEWLWSFGT